MKRKFKAWVTSKIVKWKRKSLGKSSLNSAATPTYWSPRLGRWLAIGVNAGALIRSHPFHWDLESNELKLLNGRWDMVLWGFNIVFDAMYFSFVAYQTFIGNDLERRGNLLMKFCAILFIGPLVSQVWLLKYARNSLPYVTIQGLRFAKDFHRQVPPVVGSGGKILELRVAEHFLAFLFVGTQLCACFFTLLNVFQPNLRIFLSSVKLSRFQNLQYAISVVAFGHYGQNFVTLLYIITFPGTLMIFGIIAALKGMRHSSAMQCKRTSLRLLASYREVRILVSRFFSVYESFALPAGETMTILVTIYAIVCALWLQDFVGALIGAIGFITYVTLVVLFRELAEIQVRSEKLLRHWRRQGTLDRRTWRYLQSCKCALGSFGFIDPGLILTVTQIIVSNAVSLFLVIQNK